MWESWNLFFLPSTQFFLPCVSWIWVDCVGVWMAAFMHFTVIICTYCCFWLAVKQLLSISCRCSLCGCFDVVSALCCKLLSKILKLVHYCAEKAELCVPHVCWRCSLSSSMYCWCKRAAGPWGEVRVIFECQWVVQNCGEPVLCIHRCWWWFRGVGAFLDRAGLQSSLVARPQWTMRCSGQVEFDFKCLEKWNFSERRVENWNAADEAPVHDAECILRLNKR